MDFGDTFEVAFLIKLNISSVHTCRLRYWRPEFSTYLGSNCQQNRDFKTLHSTTCLNTTAQNWRCCRKPHHFEVFTIVHTWHIVWYQLILFHMWSYCYSNQFRSSYLKFFWTFLNQVWFLQKPAFIKMFLNGLISDGSTATKIRELGVVGRGDLRPMDLDGSSWIIMDHHVSSDPYNCGLSMLKLCVYPGETQKHQR